jgi:hypothetical protein
MHRITRPTPPRKAKGQRKTKGQRQSTRESSRPKNSSGGALPAPNGNARGFVPHPPSASASASDSGNINVRITLAELQAWFKSNIEADPGRSMRRRSTYLETRRMSTSMGMEQEGAPQQPTKVKDTGLTLPRILK